MRKMNLKGMRKRDYAFLGTWAFYLYTFSVFFNSWAYGGLPPSYFVSRYYLLFYPTYMGYDRTVTDPGPSFYHLLPATMPYYEKILVNFEWNLLHNPLVIHILSILVVAFGAYIFVSLAMQKRRVAPASIS